MGYAPYLFALYMASVDGAIISLLKAQKTGMINSLWIFPLAFIVYGTQPLIFYWGLGFSSMTVLNIFWDVMSDLIVTAIGFYIFGEKLSTLQCIGLALSLAGITLLGAH